MTELLLLLLKGAAAGGAAAAGADAYRRVQARRRPTGWRAAVARIRR